MKYFFSGIGGIGMSSLALYSYYSGNKVYGTNNEVNERVEHLEKKGIDIKIGHDTLPNVDILVRSTAIKDDNPEIITANKVGIPVLYRMEYLNHILKNNWSIGITGTDGKTSTTAMVSQIFKVAKKDPTVFLGGIHDSLEDGNFRIGTGQVIAEVDESDGFIKNSQSDVVIINNLRPDHLEHYNNDFQNLENSLKRYAKKTRDILFLNGDDPILSTWKLNVPQQFFFGKGENCQYKMKNRKTVGRYQEFEMYYKDNFIGKVTLPIPGEHYAYDALAASALAIEYGIDFKTIHEALFTYNTVNRRFNILYSNSSIFVIDDYAHTPEEISMTIDAAREYFPNKKIITIFQPHRYTRLYRHMQGFVNALNKSDEVFVYRIYSAFENPIEGVDESKIINLLNIKSFYFSDEKKLTNTLIDYDESVLLFVGAGDITKVANKVGRIFKNKNHCD